MARSFNHMNPFDFVDLGLLQSRLALSSIETIWHRSSLYSQGTLSTTEFMKMWAEKPTAIAKGVERATMATVHGKSPAQIAQAAIAPMTEKASSNARRLRGK